MIITVVAQHASCKKFEEWVQKNPNGPYLRPQGPVLVATQLHKCEACGELVTFVVKTGIV